MLNMGQFEVYSSFPGDFTLISNRFLEDYMPKANGEFVKIYLYLLGRCQGGKTTMDLSSIADTVEGWMGGFIKDDIVRCVLGVAF